MTPDPTSQIHQDFDRQGFVQLRGAIPTSVLAGLREGLDPLREARDSLGERGT